MAGEPAVYPPPMRTIMLAATEPLTQKDTTTFLFSSFGTRSCITSLVPEAPACVVTSLSDVREPTVSLLSMLDVP